MTTTTTTTPPKRILYYGNIARFRAIQPTLISAVAAAFLMSWAGSVVMGISFVVVFLLVGYYWLTVQLACRHCGARLVSSADPTRCRKCGGATDLATKIDAESRSV